MKIDEPEVTENKEVEETKEETKELENEEEQILTVV
jgi:hypothetical protein